MCNERVEVMTEGCSEFDQLEQDHDAESKLDFETTRCCMR